MPNEPVSQMVRVPTPLIEGVRELSRLHRAGRTKAVLEGIKKLVTAIDSSAAVDIDSVATAISTLSQRLDKLEKQRPHVSSTDDIGSISERLEKVESDIRSIQSTMADLTARVEGVGYIGNTLTPTTELASSDIEAIAQLPEPTDTSSDIEENNNSDRTALASGSEPETGVEKPEAPLTQSALAKRLRVSNHVVQKQKQYGRENFAAWSKERDPDGIAWSWQGKLWKGKPMRFVPASSSTISGR